MSLVSILRVPDLLVSERPGTPVNFFIFEATAARCSFCSVAMVAARYKGGGLRDG